MATTGLEHSGDDRFDAASDDGPAFGKALFAAGKHLEMIGVVIGWALLTVLAWVVLSRWTGTSWPAALTPLLQGTTPVIFLPAYPLVIVAWFRRRRGLALAALVMVLVHLASTAPAVGSSDTPPWATSAPAINVFAANVYDANSNVDEAVSFLLSQRVDVLVLVEVTEEFAAALDAAGAARAFPHQFSTLRDDGSANSTTQAAEVILSRRPLTRASKIQIGVQGFPSVDVQVGERALELVGVHVVSPLHGDGEWRQELADLRRYAATRRDAFCLIGDFNSTRWNPPFGALLGDGLLDAHESRGQGLTFSWPTSAPGPPFLRLDHALTSDGVVALSVRDTTVPGSDHRGMTLELSVAQPDEP